MGEKRGEAKSPVGGRKRTFPAGQTRQIDLHARLVCEGEEREQRHPLHLEGEGRKAKELMISLFSRI